MTDKKIIIDGVDVGECEFYNKINGYSLTLKMNLQGFKNPSCFAGDFQECIQDSKICPNTFCHNNPNCYYKQLQRKEHECEIKQKTLEIQKSWIDDLKLQLQTLKAENEELKKAMTTLAEGLNIRQTKCEYYKQTLEKIEKYTKTTLRMPLERRVILNIINEVKDA